MSGRAGSGTRHTGLQQLLLKSAACNALSTDAVAHDKVQATVDWIDRAARAALLEFVLKLARAALLLVNAVIHSPAAGSTNTRPKLQHNYASG